jgi:hypothetical protein
MRFLTKVYEHLTECINMYQNISKYEIITDMSRYYIYIYILLIYLIIYLFIYVFMFIDIIFMEFTRESHQNKIPKQKIAIAAL